MTSHLSPRTSHLVAGFTLVEALVALTLLTVGLIPAFLQASNALALSTSVRNSLVAANLAQGGIEIARSIRDANWFTGSPFVTGLDGCAAGCRVEYNSTSVLPLAGNPALKWDSATGLYQYGVGSDSLFHRQLTIEQVSAHELKVVSLVDWSERSGAKSFSIEYHLYDWLQ